MICKNCAAELERLSGTTWQICKVCGLVHDELGSDLGWPVRVKNSPGGLIERSAIEAIVADRPLKPADVAYAVRIAAQVGLQYPDVIRVLIRQEEREDVMAVVRRLAALTSWVDA